MSPNGRRAWRRAAKKLRRKLGLRWRSQKEWLHGKRWSELVPDLEARRGHITGAWFRRHGCTDQGLQTLDAPNMVRVYIGLWGTADGDGVEYAVRPQPFTARSLVGMTMGARKRAARIAYIGGDEETIALASKRTWLLCWRKGTTGGMRITKKYATLRAKYRIGERLRPCPGCMECDPSGFASICDGSGVLPARRS